MKTIGPKYGNLKNLRGQAQELNVEVLLSEPRLLDAAPTHVRSCVFPYQVTLITTLLMYRGITARSLRRKQI